MAAPFDAVRRAPLSPRDQPEACVFEPLESRIALSAIHPIQHQLFFPEGFAGRNIKEYMPLVNPHDQAVEYTVWARFESGPRDLLLERGLIAPNARGGLTLSDGAHPELNLVPERRPYAITVESTLPLAGTVTRYDRGATGEAMTAHVSTTWAIANASVTAGKPTDFLVWQNASSAAANLTITFVPFDDATGEPPSTVVLTRTTEGMRRGGISLGATPELRFLSGRPIAIEVVADQPIVVGASHYGPEGSSMTMGIPDTGWERGVFPRVQWNGFAVGPTNDTELRFFNPTGEDAVIDLSFRDGNGERIAIAGAVRVDARGASLVRLSDFFEGEVPFSGSVEFTSTQRVIAASLERSADLVPGEQGLLSAPFEASGHHRLFFAEGFMDPARAGRTLFSSVTISNGLTPINALNPISLTFRFTDGHVLEGPSLALQSGQVLTLELHSLDALLAEGRDHGRYYFSVEVRSEIAPVQAAMVHNDGLLGDSGFAGGMLTLGTPLFDLVIAG